MENNSPFLRCFFVFNHSDVEYYAYKLEQNTEEFRSLIQAYESCTNWQRIIKFEPYKHENEDLEIEDANINFFAFEESLVGHLDATVG